MSGNIMGRTRQGYAVVESYHCLHASAGGCAHVLETSRPTPERDWRLAAARALGEVAAGAADERPADRLLAGDALGLTALAAEVGGLAEAEAFGRLPVLAGA